MGLGIQVPFYSLQFIMEIGKEKDRKTLVMKEDWWEKEDENNETVILIICRNICCLFVKSTI